jgi:hypothetical protein
MKFLFSSSDFSLIEGVRQTLASSGIRCEIRGIHPVEAAPGHLLYVELWVGRGLEFSQAVSLFSSGIALQGATVEFPAAWLN